MGAIILHSSNIANIDTCISSYFDLSLSEKIALLKANIALVNLLYLEHPRYRRLSEYIYIYIFNKSRDEMLCKCNLLLHVFVCKTWFFCDILPA